MDTRYGRPPGNGRIEWEHRPWRGGGSLVFMPGMRRYCKIFERIWEAHLEKSMGFVDAFNPLTGWASSDVLGIDAG